MKKRILSAVMALSMLGGYAASAEGGKVEITFRVGDSVLTVNGAPLEVTAPYIVGEGTTLVPVRVITEAFGAEVVWNGEDQSVNLKYPDVDITIRIGSKSATVNTHTEELAEAPQLYMDTTMVPLRFISETFGATVNWDDGLITVTKEALTTGTTVEGATDMEYIGDSYYGWSIKNPKKLQMASRNFDGSETVFEDEEGYGIAIAVNTGEEKFDVDTEFNNLKNMLAGSTLTRADKETLGNGVTKIRIGAKNKELINEILAYIEGNRIYAALLVVGTDSDMKDELMAIEETFMIKSTREMYDLSNAKGGYREFYDDYYKVGLKLPASWVSDEEDSNVFRFHDAENDVANATIGIYSKTESTNAAALAAADRAERINVSNEELAVISEVTKGKIGQYDSYTYTIDYNGDGLNYNYFMNDTFIDYGNYVYNITVEEKSPEAAAAILKTFTLEELDSAEIGNIIRESDIETTAKFDILGGKMTASSMWTPIKASNVVIDRRTGSGISLINVGKVESSADLVEGTQSILRGMLEEGCCVTVKSMNSYKTDSLGMVYTFTVRHTPEEEEESPSYITTYVFKADDEAYVATYTRYDIFYDSGLDEEVKAIIESFEI